MPLLPAPDDARFAIGRRILDVGAPAAATDWDYVLPSGYDWKLLLAFARLTTSATAGNRLPGFHVYTPDPGGGGFNTIMYGLPLGAAQQFGPGLVVNCHYAISDNPSSAPIVAASSIMLATPDVLLPGGWHIGSESQLLSGDQYDRVTLLLEAYEPLPAV